jgi:hypothetical protein
VEFLRAGRVEFEELEVYTSQGAAEGALTTPSLFHPHWVVGFSPAGVQAFTNLALPDSTSASASVIAEEGEGDIRAGVKEGEEEVCREGRGKVADIKNQSGNRVAWLGPRGIDWPSVNAAAIGPTTAKVRDQAIYNP